MHRFNNTEMFSVSSAAGLPAALPLSVKGIIWGISTYDERTVQHLAQVLAIPEVLAIVMYNRGVRTQEEAWTFLNPTVRSLLPDPMELIDMHNAVERICKAVIQKQKVVVFGDYDVDGATSTALLRSFFGSIGLEVGVYIPNRISEGYGPNVQAFDKIKKNGCDLVITVDCGTVSFEAMEYAAKIGLDVIILDHHLSLDVLPKACAVVNPNRFDEEFNIKNLAAVGVVFLTTIAVRKSLRERGYFKDMEEPDLLSYLDLVALGTSCDVMELVGLNRAFVHQGLKIMNQRRNVGLSVLADVCKIDGPIQSYHLGFALGPRINAGGRVGEGLLGSELLYTNDPDLALNIAMRLEVLNQSRKEIEFVALQEAVEQVESSPSAANDPMIMVVGKDWHQGILGIIASRLKERYGKPAFVISGVEEALKGSSRSIAGIDVGSILANAKVSGVILQGGGHAMAGGFSLETGMVEEFRRFMLGALSGANDAIQSAKHMSIDAEISLSAVTGETVRLLSRAAPFGAGNAQPKFLFRDVVVRQTRLVGESHMMIIISDSKSDVSNSVKCMMFKAMDSDYAPMLVNMIGKRISIIGYLQMHYLDPKKSDVIVEDIIFS